jgi:CHAT domain-containing protein
LVAQDPAPADGPPVLDLLLPEFMIRAEQNGNLDHALEAAHLVCDVRLAVALAGGKHWKRMGGGDLLNAAGLDLRVVFDAVRMLLDAQRIDEALELLQRVKAPAYCVPQLLRLHANGAPILEAAAFVDAALELQQCLEGLAAPAPRDVVRPANDMRRAGERMRETGEALREIDPILLARLGGLVRRDELIGALPYQGGVGIVDFMVGADSTVGVVLGRDNHSIFAAPIAAASFTAAHAKQLLDLYRAANLPQQLGGAHTEALLQMGKILHDKLLCGLARELSKRGITQLILIPDLLTRNVPLHLSFACGKEISIPGIETNDASFLCEVMPVEYAPCLQAVAASRVYVRPRTIKRIAAFADPNGDLPGVRESMEQFGAAAPDPSVFSLASGAAATKAAVTKALPEADVVIFGTHGEFTPGDLERTCLVLSGEPWTGADMLQMADLKKRALLVLVACKAGAIDATPDDRRAWGIPGALLSGGASAVLANLWPVEDVTSNYLLERFLAHLGHRGFRPAAALFRAVRDLRRMTRDDAITYCRKCLERQKQAKAPASVLVGTRSILQWVEDCDDLHPFASPFFWGASTIFGSGWHLPAGASVGSASELIDDLLQLSNAEELMRQGRLHQALEHAKTVAVRSDGATRGYAYTTIAWTRLLVADLSTRQQVRREAVRLLNEAERIATSEQDENLLKRVLWMRKRMETEYVVENND